MGDGPGAAEQPFGIDLGATCSAIAFVDETGRAVVCRNDHNSETTPSVVHFETPDQVVVGQMAKDFALVDPENVVSLIIRRMGDDVPYQFHGQRYNPESISALILRSLISTATSYTGGEVHRAVITVPAYFDARQREATQRAGFIAGLDVIDIIPEPVAATMHYQNLVCGDGERTVLVYNLGGSTFETTIVRISATNLTVVRTDGDTELGGADWTQRLRDHLLQRFVTEVSPARSPQDDPEFMQHLTSKAEDVKKQLSSRESRPVSLAFEGDAALIEVARSAFELLTADLLDRTIEVVRRTLATLDDDDEMRGPAISEVLLVGGASLMPMVTNRLVRQFGWTPRTWRPDVAVVTGAAHYARSRMVWQPEKDLHFEPHAYEDQVLKPMHRVIPNLPDDLSTRYAVHPGMDAGTLRVRVYTVLKLWNKLTLRPGRAGMVAKLLIHEHSKLQAGGNDLSSSAFWDSWFSQRKQAFSTAINALADHLKAENGVLGAVTEAQLRRAAMLHDLLDPAAANRARQKAGLRLVDPVELPTSPGTRVQFRVLNNALLEAGAISIPELLFPGLISFGLLDGLRISPPPVGRTVALTPEAAIERIYDLDRMPDSGHARAQRYALSILVTEGKAGADLSQVALFHLLQSVRESQADGASTGTIFYQLTRAKLERGDAARVTLSLIVQGAAPRQQSTEISNIPTPLSATTSAKNDENEISSHITPVPAGIFLSYRRTDDPGFAGRIYDRLASEFGAGQVFMDVDSIEYGRDFYEELRNALTQCKVMLAVIGKGWASSRGDDGMLRLHDPNDYVRLEIEEALAISTVRVIPVLIGNTRMPTMSELPQSLSSLPRRNAYFVSHTSFRADLDKLIKVLRRILGIVDQ